MHRTGAHRLRALGLILTLVIGGFGLPLLDTLCFHSFHAAAPAPQSDSLQTHRDGGGAHLFGCAILTTAVTGPGLPVGGTPSITAVKNPEAPGRPLPAVLVSQTDRAFSQPRAPPIA